MLNLTDLKVLILESNNLTNLTVNSLEKNTPQVSYKVITKKEQTNSTSWESRDEKKKIIIIAFCYCHEISDKFLGVGSVLTTDLSA